MLHVLSETTKSGSRLKEADLAPMHNLLGVVRSNTILTSNTLVRKWATKLEGRLGLCDLPPPRVRQAKGSKSDGFIAARSLVLTCCLRVSSINNGLVTRAWTTFRRGIRCSRQYREHDRKPPYLTSRPGKPYFWQIQCNNIEFTS